MQRESLVKNTWLAKGYKREQTRLVHAWFHIPHPFVMPVRQDLASDLHQVWLALFSCSMGLGG